jgi:hypothetical protein
LPTHCPTTYRHTQNKRDLLQAEANSREYNPLITNAFCEFPTYYFNLRVKRRFREIRRLAMLTRDEHPSRMLVLPRRKVEQMPP